MIVRCYRRTVLSKIRIGALRAAPVTVPMVWPASMAVAPKFPGMAGSASE